MANPFLEAAGIQPRSQQLESNMPEPRCHAPAIWRGHASGEPWREGVGQLRCGQSERGTKAYGPSNSS